MSVQILRKMLGDSRENVRSPKILTMVKDVDSIFSWLPLIVRLLASD